MILFLIFFFLYIDTVKAFKNKMIFVVQRSWQCYFHILATLAPTVRVCSALPYPEVLWSRPEKTRNQLVLKTEP